MTARSTKSTHGKRKPARAWLYGTALLSIAGCAATPHVDPDVATTGIPNAELALRRSMQEVDAQMAQISSMQPTLPVSESPATPILPAELTKSVAFIWSGPLDAGVQKLAKSIGYTVTISAPAKAIKLGVAVSIEGQVIGAFKELGDQAGTYATVSVDPLHHSVQVTHHV